MKKKSLTIEDITDRVNKKFLMDGIDGDGTAVCMFRINPPMKVKFFGDGIEPIMEEIEVKKATGETIMERVVTGHIFTGKNRGNQVLETLSIATVDDVATLLQQELLELEIEKTVEIQKLKAQIAELEKWQETKK